MRRFINVLVSIVMTQSMLATSHAVILDLPNPESDEMDLPRLSLPLPIEEVAPPVVNLGRYSGGSSIAGITRKTNGLVYRVEVKPAVALSKVLITAETSKLKLHETYLITESGSKIKIHEFSRSVAIENKTTGVSENLNSRERIVAIDLRAESMQAEATIQVVAYSDEGALKLSLHKPLASVPVPAPAPPQPPRYVGPELSCRWNGEISQPYNSTLGIYLGRPGYGFTYKETCDASIEVARKAGGSAICSWNGHVFLIYDTDGSGQIGRSGYGFSNLDGCYQVLRDSVNGLYCSWNGHGYSPYDKSKYTNIGKSEHGFTHYKTCVDNMKTATHGALCNWNGQNYQPYIISSNSGVGKNGYGFQDLATCQRSISTAKNRFICNWTGVGYARYDMTAPSTNITGTYENLTNCMNN